MIANWFQIIKTSDFFIAKSCMISVFDNKPMILFYTNFYDLLPKQKTRYSYFMYVRSAREGAIKLYRSISKHVCEAALFMKHHHRMV